MSSASKAPPRSAFLASVIAAGLFAWTVHRLQNSVVPMGGAIALEKTLWLTTALFAWFIMPALIAADSRMPKGVRRGYVVFLLFMLARGPVELWMMYVLHNWLPIYGIAHDLLAIVLLGWLFAAHREQARRGSPSQRAAVWNWIALALLFVPEMCFAGYMWTHFETRGENGIFFVPDEPQYSTVLYASAAAAGAFAAYVAAFSRAWLWKD